MTHCKGTTKDGTKCKRIGTNNGYCWQHIKSGGKGNKKDIKKDDLGNQLDDFLSTNECDTNECKIKEAKELVERINKKIITEDGRQLLI